VAFRPAILDFDVLTFEVAVIAATGGNITGTTIMTAEMGSQRLELVRRLLPNAASLAILVNPNFTPSTAEAREARLFGPSTNC
jgi:ABC-type uncharacterized transport system substrate-binding protein